MGKAFGNAEDAVFAAADEGDEFHFLYVICRGRKGGGGEGARQQQQ